jgi:hypothetical protein
VNIGNRDCIANIIRGAEKEFGYDTEKKIIGIAIISVCWIPWEMVNNRKEK